MTKKEDLLKEMREDFRTYVEEFLKIKDKDGNLIEFKLSRFQLKILDSLITKNLQNFRSISTSRIRKRF